MFVTDIGNAEKVMAEHNKVFHSIRPAATIVMVCVCVCVLCVCVWSTFDYIISEKPINSTEGGSCAVYAFVHHIGYT